MPKSARQRIFPSTPRKIRELTQIEPNQREV